MGGVCGWLGVQQVPNQGSRQCCSLLAMCDDSYEVIKNMQFCFYEKLVPERKPPATTSHGRQEKMKRSKK